jgi:hypothetical protein
MHIICLKGVLHVCRRQYEREELFKRVSRKKLDLKGCNFKPMRGIETSTIMLMTEELRIAEMTTECRKVKALKELQKAFVEETGVKSWEEAEEKLPEFANAEALDQFIEGNTAKNISSNPFNLI